MDESESYANRSAEFLIVLMMRRIGRLQFPGNRGARTAVAMHARVGLPCAPGAVPDYPALDQPPFSLANAFEVISL